MKIKKSEVILPVLLFILSVTNSAIPEEETQKKDLIFFIKEPIKTIFAPIKGEGLVDLVFMPAERVLPAFTDFKSLVVTPGRTSEYVYNINKNISIIDSDLISEQDPVNVQYLLQEAAGVLVSGFLGNSKDASVDMRGFGEAGNLNYLVLVDGRRTNQIDLSGVDLAQIDVSSIDRIEVIRGASSVLYGDNATGGVVNVITKRGREGDHIEYKQEFGSYQSSKEYFSFDGGHDFLDYFFSYSYQDSEGYRLNNALEANDIFTRFTVKPSDILELDCSANYHRDWYGTPGALFDGNIQRDGREGSRTPNSKSKTEDYYVTLIPTYFTDFGDHEAVLSSFFSYRSRRFNARDVSTIVFETNHHITSVDFRPKVEINSDFFDESLENKLVLGVDYFSADDEVLSGDITFTKSQIDIVKRTFGIYASDNMLINKRFIINGGVRGEWLKYTFDQKQPSSDINKEEIREIALDAGLGYKYNDTSQIYFNYARSYRYPNTDELFQSAFESFDFFTGVVRTFPAVLNTSLKQQVANNYEIGIKDNSFAGFNINADYYLIDNKNEIYFDPISFLNTNYHSTIHHGFEFEARARLFDMVDGYFTYTFQKAFFVGGDFASKDIPLVPRNKFTGGINIKLFDSFNINYALNYVGSRFIISDQVNSVSKLESYTTMDLGLSYELYDFTIFGNIRNILNEKYFSSAIKNFAGNPAFFPAPELNFECGVSYKF